MQHRRGEAAGRNRCPKSCRGILGGRCEKRCNKPLERGRYLRDNTDETILSTLSRWSGQGIRPQTSETRSARTVWRPATALLLGRVYHYRRGSLADFEGRLKMLSRTDREAILHRVSRLVQQKHFNPSFAGANWATILESRISQILDAENPDVFESEMHDLVSQLKTTHTGFFHKDARRIPARHAINATFHRQTVDGKNLWMFQDVHMGGPAYTAGIRPGDLLLKVADRTLEPPTELVFPMSAAVRIVVRKPDGAEILHSLQIPTPKTREHP